MKYFMCLCLLNYFVVSFGFSLNESCIAKSGLKLENVRNLMLNGEPESQEELCFLGCFWKKIKTMNPDNTMNMEEIKKKFQAVETINEDFYDAMMEAYATCDIETKTQVVNVDECEAANIISKCVNPKIKEIRDELVSEVFDK